MSNGVSAHNRFTMNSSSNISFIQMHFQLSYCLIRLSVLLNVSLKNLAHVLYSQVEN